MKRDELLEHFGIPLEMLGAFQRAGYALVPLEPTGAMIKAGQKPPPRSPKYTKLTGHSVVSRWKAMIEASDA